jgi:plastocyanin
MRKIGLAFVVAACALATAAPAIAADATVRITETGFTPLAVTIERGDAVTWRNIDSKNHQVVADNGAFRSPVLQPGQTYTFEFNRTGTFLYSDANSSFRKGTVAVEPVAVAEPAVTIQASRNVVTFGGAVVLSGTISSREPGDVVRVTGRPYRGTPFTRFAETNADGAWRLLVRPKIRTIFRAFWQGADSSTQPVVHVRSRVGFSVQSHAAARFYTRAFAGYSYRGKLARLQRLSPSGWVTARTFRLNARSAATFRARLPGGQTRVRVVVPASPGYLTGISNVRIVRR